MELVLKQVRERCGYTQRQLADELGVKVATYRTWEQGSVKLTLENAFNIANVLGCTPNDLCDWYATHPRERPRRSDPEREALLANYDRCTPERRDMLMQQAMDGAYISQERPERDVPAAREAE